MIGDGFWLRRLLRTAYFIVLLLVACDGEPAPQAAPNGNSIPIAPEFQVFYDSYGGRRVFGAPITDVFVPEENSHLVQYFQTMRLEYDEDSESIVVYPLGEWALAGVNESVPESEPDETIASEFQAFIEEHNGAQLFGRVISPVFEENDALVQYFRNGRLEWHPELPPTERVQVGHLAQAHFDAEMIYEYRQRLLAQPVPFAGLSEVELFASVQAPILYAGEEQVLYVTALTPAGRPVSGIEVGLQVIPEGDQADAGSFVLGQTDDRGKLVTTLELDDLSPGQQVQLLILAYASNNTVIGSTRVTFKTWW